MNWKGHLFRTIKERISCRKFFQKPPPVRQGEGEKIILELISGL
jgi:hypothetical protein